MQLYLYNYKYQIFCNSHSIFLPNQLNKKKNKKVWQSHFFLPINFKTPKNINFTNTKLIVNFINVLKIFLKKGKFLKTTTVFLSALNHVIYLVWQKLFVQHLTPKQLNHFSYYNTTLRNKKTYLNPYLFIYLLFHKTNLIFDFKYIPIKNKKRKKLKSKYLISYKYVTKKNRFKKLIRNWETYMTLIQRRSLKDRIVFVFLDMFINYKNSMPFIYQREIKKLIIRKNIRVLKFKLIYPIKINKNIV